CYVPDHIVFAGFSLVLQAEKMALAFVLLRRIAAYTLLLIPVIIADAQSFKLYVAEMNNASVTSVQLVDSANGSVAGPVFHEATPVIYYAKGNDIIGFRSEEHTSELQ